jgi:hypothetical protein
MMTNTSTSAQQTSGNSLLTFIETTIKQINGPAYDRTSKSLECDGEKFKVEFLKTKSQAQTPYARLPEDGTIFHAKATKLTFAKNEKRVSIEIDGKEHPVTGWVPTKEYLPNYSVSAMDIPVVDAGAKTKMMPFVTNADGTTIPILAWVPAYELEVDYVKAEKQKMRAADGMDFPIVGWIPSGHDLPHQTVFLPTPAPPKDVGPAKRARPVPSAMQIIWASIMESPKKIFAINACAGTGKTQLARAVLDQLKDGGRYYSPTRILAERGPPGVSYTCDKFIKDTVGIRDITKWFDIKKEINEVSAYRHLNPSTIPGAKNTSFLMMNKMNHIRVVFIDEFTLLGHNTLLFFTQLIRATCPKAKIILLGDILQNSAINASPINNELSLMIAQEIYAANAHMRASDEALKNLLRMLESGDFDGASEVIKTRLVPNIKMRDLYENGKFKNTKIITTTNGELYNITTTVAHLLSTQYNIPVYWQKNQIVVKQGEEQKKTYSYIPLILGMDYRILHGQYKEHVGTLMTITATTVCLKIGERFVLFGRTKFPSPTCNIKEDWNSYPIFPAFCQSSYTVQGLTISDNIYCMAYNMNSKNLYVALSRGITLDKLFVYGLDFDTDEAKKAKAVK